MPGDGCGEKITDREIDERGRIPADHVRETVAGRDARSGWHIRFTSHQLPVADLLEGRRRPVDGALVVVPADEHHARGEAVDHAAGDAHRGMAGDVEGRGIGQHLEGALAVERQGGVRRRQRGRPHWGRRHQQEVIGLQHGVIAFLEPPSEVLRLGVVMPAVVPEEILTDEHADLQRVRQLVGPAAPVGVMVEQTGGVHALPAGPHAVALQHLVGEALNRDGCPDGSARQVHGNRDLVHRRAHLGEDRGGLAHFAGHARVQVG